MLAPSIQTNAPGPTFDHLLSNINSDRRAQQSGSTREVLPQPLRVLVFDGAWPSVLNLYILRRLEREQLGFLSKTSVFGGTSDGGIVALLLSYYLQKGLSAHDAIDNAIRVQKKFAGALSPSPMQWAKFILGRAPLTGSATHDVLKEAFGEEKMGFLADRPVSLPALNPVQQGISTFAGFGPFANPDMPIWRAAAAVSSLPFLIPVSRVMLGDRQKRWNDQAPGDWLLDGGLANNDPTMTVVGNALLALSENNAQRTDYFLTAKAYVPYLRVLSLGGSGRRWSEDLLNHGDEPQQERPRGPHLELDDPLEWGWPKLLKAAGPGAWADLMVGAGSFSNSSSVKQLLGVHRYFRFHPEMNISKRMLALMFGTKETWKERAWSRKARVDHLVKGLETRASRAWSDDAAQETKDKSSSDPYTRNSLQGWVRDYWMPDWHPYQKRFY